MPLYVYKCSSCGEHEEIIRKVDDRDALAICEKCGSISTRVMVFSKNRDWFRPFVHEDFDIKPIYVESKKHYKQLCKQYGVTARCLL